MFFRDKTRVLILFYMNLPLTYSSFCDVSYA